MAGNRTRARSRRRRYCPAMRPVLAAVAALALLPATAAASAGSSCADPLTWQLSAHQLRQANPNPVSPATLHHGPLTLSSDSGDPYAPGPLVTVSAARPWRICDLHGRDRGGHAYAMPGTTGHGGHVSFAARRFRHAAGAVAGSIAVRYARRSGRDGTTCPNPLVAFGPYYGGQPASDPGATITTKATPGPSAGDPPVLTAEWHLAAGSHVCFVEGWSTGGEPWVVDGGGSGSHVLQRRLMGNHDNPLLFLWIAFTR